MFCTLNKQTTDGLKCSSYHPNWFTSHWPDGGKAARVLTVMIMSSVSSHGSLSLRFTYQVEMGGRTFPPKTARTKKKGREEAAQAAVAVLMEEEEEEEKKERRRREREREGRRRRRREMMRRRKKEEGEREEERREEVRPQVRIHTHTLLILKLWICCQKHVLHCSSINFPI